MFVVTASIDNRLLPSNCDTLLRTRTVTWKHPTLCIYVVNFQNLLSKLTTDNLWAFHHHLNHITISLWFTQTPRCIFIHRVSVNSKNMLTKSAADSAVLRVVFWVEKMCRTSRKFHVHFYRFIWFNTHSDQRICWIHFMLVKYYEIFWCSILRLTAMVHIAQYHNVTMIPLFIHPFKSLTLSYCANK